MPLLLYEDSPLAAAVVGAIRSGDIMKLKQLLADHPGLASARIEESSAAQKRGTRSMSRTLLHVTADWPGHVPNGAAAVAALAEAGGDVNARFIGPHEETALHWAASSNDTDVLDALLDAGADINSPGAVIGGGTPLDDAVAFGQWQAARRLVQRGAQLKLWNAAALGLMDYVKACYKSNKPPGADETTQAFWLACHGGQLKAAQFLAERGADLNWIGYDALTPLDAASRSNAMELVEWLLKRGARPGST
ncbi:ankyrin repeat domain-containing protein [Paenibacillus gansuensis]|uniref:Ankyrin repeat domain-containing protein n=1 Tax=Paenibacillus gansuensis TaxID=306542 RepID=A0ABW5PJK3_9BACL